MTHNIYCSAAITATLALVYGFVRLLTLPWACAICFVLAMAVFRFIDSGLRNGGRS